MINATKARSKQIRSTLAIQAQGQTTWTTVIKTGDSIADSSAAQDTIVCTFVGVVVAAAYTAAERWDSEDSTEEAGTPFGNAENWMTG